MTESAYATQLYNLAVQIEALETQRDDLIIQRHILSITVTRDGFDPEPETPPEYTPPPPNKSIPAYSYESGYITATNTGSSNGWQVEIHRALPDGTTTGPTLPLTEAYPIGEHHPLAVGFKVRGTFYDPNGSPDWVTEWSELYELPTA